MSAGTVNYHEKEVIRMIQNILKWGGVLLLLIAAIHDIRRRTVPRWTLAAAGALSAAAVTAGLLSGSTSPVYLAFALLPGILLLSLSFLSGEGIGYGDGLMGLCIGPVFGAEAMAAGICMAFFLSALLSVVLLVLRRADRKTRLPFIPFLAAAMGGVCVVLG